MLEVDILGNQSPGAFLTHRYVLELQPEGSPPFQTEVTDAFNVAWAPKRGDLLDVKFNPKSRKAAFDLKGDPRYDSDLQQQPGQWTPGEARPPSVLGAALPTNIPAPSDGAGETESRLQKLDRLRDGGVITAEEYDAQRRRVLDSL